jgi:putative copper export protein
MSAIQRRLSTLVYVSIVGLVGTGLLMSRRSPAFQGFLNFGTPYATALSLKHLLVIAMVAVALVRSLGLRPTQDNVSPSRERLSGGLLLLNVVLGIAVLLLSGFTAAFAGTPPP